MKILRRALSYMAPYWGWQAAALVCALIVSATEFIWPYVNKVLVDRILWPQSGTDAERLSALYQMSTYVMAALVTGALFGLLKAYLFARVGESAAADLRRDLYDHLHSLPMAYFDRGTTGGIMSVTQNDVEALQGLYSSTLVDAITNLLMVAIAVSLMFWRSPHLALLSLPVPILFAVALILFGRPLRNAGRRVREETGHVQEVLQESIAGSREVKLFDQKARERERAMGQVARLVRSRIGQAVLGASNGSVSNLIAVCGMTMILLIGSRQVIARQMMAGDVILFISVLGMLFGPASMFVNLYSQVAGAVGAADRIFEFLDNPTEVEQTGRKSMDRVEGHVRFESVCFRYEADEQEALRDIDLEVKPGEVIAVVGPSGAGKTTLVSLLPRLYDVSSGRVLIDGTNVRETTLASLRANIAIVPQEPFLFGTSVAENIGFGRVGATRAEIIEAAQAANAHEFISALPEGYDTPLGERGTRLSGGQKQRIALARAILRNPRILILDEATSAQDSESERQIQEAMGRLMRGRTSFVIAHRLSTVQRADRIVVLEEGRIVETGTHTDLLASGGLYARLHAFQFADQRAAEATDCVNITGASLPDGQIPAEAIVRSADGGQAR